MGTEFLIAIGVFPVELSACQVSMFRTGISQDSSIYILDITLVECIVKHDDAKDRKRKYCP